MGLVVFTGGVRSGKSAAATALARERLRAMAPYDARVVTVVFGDETDAEMAQRIARHRDDRPDAFEALEADSSVTWTAEVPADAILLVDCLGTLLGRIMHERASALLSDADPETLPAEYAEAVGEHFDRAVDWIVSRDGDTIVVTNEVGDGIVPAYASARLFRDLMGRANRRLVDAADAAFLVTAGRLIALSPLPREARWPED